MPFRPGCSTRSGNVVIEILVAAAECQTDLIVMATAGHQGFLDALRGSTTERVLRDARFLSVAGNRVAEAR